MRNAPAPRHGAVWHLFAWVGRVTAGVSIWLSPMLAGAGGILALFAGFSIWLRIAAVPAIAASVVIGVGRSVWRNELARQDEDVALKLVAKNGEFADGLSELARWIADIGRAPAPQRRARLEETCQQATNLIVSILHREVSGVRAVVYEITKETPQGLTPVRWSFSGHRADPNPFLPGTPRNTKALRLLQERDSLFVPDIAGAPREEWEGSGVGYNTFISVPIVSRERAFGMLTVDAPSTDELNESDQWNIKLVAGILAVAFSV